MDWHGISARRQRRIMPRRKTAEIYDRLNGGNDVVDERNCAKDN